MILSQSWASAIAQVLNPTRLSHFWFYSDPKTQYRIFIEKTDQISFGSKPINLPNFSLIWISTRNTSHPNSYNLEYCIIIHFYQKNLKNINRPAFFPFLNPSLMKLRRQVGRRESHYFSSLNIFFGQFHPQLGGCLIQENRQKRQDWYKVGEELQTLITSRATAIASFRSRKCH